MDKRVKFNHRQGFTLIEIILALLVVMIGIVAVVGLLGTSLDSSARAHDDLNTVGFADMVLNYLHAEDYEHIAGSGSMTIPDYDGEASSISIGEMATYTIKRGPDDEHEAMNYPITYQLDISDRAGPNSKAVSLRIWPGYYTNTAPQSFYTEIYNWEKQ